MKLAGGLLLLGLVYFVSHVRTSEHQTDLDERQSCERLMLRKSQLWQSEDGGWVAHSSLFRRCILGFFLSLFIQKGKLENSKEDKSGLVDSFHLTSHLTYIFFCEQQI